MLVAQIPGEEKMNQGLRCSAKRYEKLLKANAALFDALVDVIDDFRQEPWQPDCFDEFGLFEWMNELPEELENTKLLHELFDGLYREFYGVTTEEAHSVHPRHDGSPSSEIAEAERLVGLVDDGSEAEAEAARAALSKLPRDAMIFASALASRRSKG